MQSTGHSSMQALSLTSTHVWAMTYVTGVSSSAWAGITPIPAPRLDPKRSLSEPSDAASPVCSPSISTRRQVLAEGGDPSPHRARHGYEMSSASRARFAQIVRASPVDLGLACLLLAAEAEPTGSTVDPDIDAGLKALDDLAAYVADFGPVPSDDDEAADYLRRALADGAGF